MRRAVFLAALVGLLVTACEISVAPYQCILVTDSVVTPPPDTVATLTCR